MREGEVVKYPISEIFTSPQGEGAWAGTLMTFIRLAGCSVGQPSRNGLPLHNLDGSETGNKAWVCHAWDGRAFWCDTDFNTREVLTAEQIAERIPPGVQHVCLTGGEPLMRNLAGLVSHLVNLKGIKVHIETSGTADCNYLQLYNFGVWITVSPKKGTRLMAIQYADEVKLLVDKHFDLEKADELLDGFRRTVFIQPINEEKEIVRENVLRCLEIQKLRPEWRLSLQLHKILNVR